jgi:hypothetical protein
MLLNSARKKKGKKRVGVSSVTALHYRSKPKVMQPVVGRQGSLDPNDNWSRARMAQTGQQAVREGVGHLLKHPDGVALPDYLDLPKLIQKHGAAKVVVDDGSVCSFDGTHRKVSIGSTQTQIRYPRNKEGMIDVENGTYAPNAVNMHVKYENECRFHLGIAVVLMPQPDGSFIAEDRRSFYSYTGKTVVSIKDWGKYMAAANRRVQALSDMAPWSVSVRPKDAIYDEDPVTLLVGIGAATEKELLQLGVKTVGHLKAFTGKLNSRLNSLRAQAQTVALIGKCPAKLDHRQATNPYKSRFPETYLEEIKKDQECLPYLCIQDLVWHMVLESERMMKGSKHENNFRFAHDALSTLTAKETIEWMKTTSYKGKTLHDYWYLPIDCSAGTVFFGRPVGNSPELSPLDRQGFNYLHRAVDFHCCATSHLDDDHEYSFSISTPSRMIRTYKRIWEIAPSREQVLHDVREIKVTSAEIYNGRGIMIEFDNAKRVGNRRVGGKDVVVVGRAKHGGNRTKGDFSLDKTVVHPLLLEALSEETIRLEQEIFDQDDSDYEDSDDEEEDPFGFDSD